MRYPRRYSNSTSFHIFAERDLREYLQRRLHEMQGFITQQKESYLLNVNETDFVDYVTQQYVLDPPHIAFTEVAVDQYLREIPAEEFPSALAGFRTARTGQRYEKQVVVYHLPFTGNPDLLHCRPSSMALWTTIMFIDGHDLCFEIVDYHDNAAEVKQQANVILGNLPANAQQVVQEVERFNGELRGTVAQAFTQRKQTFLTRRNTLAALGVPIQQRTDLPQTYAIPTPAVRRSVSVKPVVAEQSFTPEPTLSQPDYESILQTIHDVGKVMERLPSIYRARGEEDLRDLLLLYLEPRYEGSATGETFNGAGKTDILMRYQQSNVFVAECKFWSGVKRFLETLTQLFGYLTWRDAKAAAVIFVRRQQMSAVMEQVERVTPTHPNYLGFLDTREGTEGTWRNYRFHINGDRNREIKLAVLLFHFPHARPDAEGAKEV